MPSTTLSGISARLCELCGTTFCGRQSKRFCTEGCRAKTERRRAAARKSPQPRKPRAVAPLPSACVDCGATEGMGWWVGKWGYESSGANRDKINTTAAKRCRDCYNAYYRAKWRARTGSTGKPPAKPWVSHLVPCLDCARPCYNRRKRCLDCKKAIDATRRGIAMARRLDAVRRGDRGIHWRPLGERDGWVCHICGGHVIKMAGTPTNRRGAVVDHLEPVGVADNAGPHTWANVSLAHWECNGKRGTGGIVQLRLVG